PTPPPQAAIARERGLEPLTDLIWAQATRLDKPRDALARPFVDAAKGVPDVEAARQGGRLGRARATSPRSASPTTPTCAPRFAHWRSPRAVSPRGSRKARSARA